MSVFVHHLPPTQRQFFYTIAHPSHDGFHAPSPTCLTVVFLHHLPPAQRRFLYTISRPPNGSFRTPSPTRPMVVLVLVQRVLLTTFNIGRCSDMGTTRMATFRLSSEGWEGVICMGTGTDGLCSSGVTCTSELDFAFVCSLLTIAFVLTGCNHLSFGR